MQNINSEEGVKRALLWILQILDLNKTPYQIVGGLAAKVYGGKRPVADIDMYIPKIFSETLYAMVKKYATKPLIHYHEDVWDLEYFQLMYEGQKIEIGLSPGARFFSKSTSMWIEQTIDFSRSTTAKFCDIEISVLPKNELIAYKKLLGREVDIVDIKELES